LEKVQTVLDGTGVYLISLPDGCTPGRWEAAIYFAEAMAELRENFPGRSFSFVAFGFSHEPSENFHGVNAWLAIAM